MILEPPRVRTAAVDFLCQFRVGRSVPNEIDYNLLLLGSF
jgi:hypothetical protein